MGDLQAVVGIECVLRAFVLGIVHLVFPFVVSFDVEDEEAFGE